MVVLRQKGCVHAKVVVLGPNLFYSDKIVVFDQKLLHSYKVFVFG